MSAWKDKFCECGKDAELLHISNGKKYWCWKCWRVEFPSGLQKMNGVLNSK
jgi:hypothetical protein